MLAEWFDFLTTKGGIGGNGRREAAMDVDMFIYLRTSPEVAYQRVQERARKEEEVRVFYFTTSFCNCKINAKVKVKIENQEMAR